MLVQNVSRRYLIGPACQLIGCTAVAHPRWQSLQSGACRTRWHSGCQACATSRSGLGCTRGHHRRCCWRYCGRCRQGGRRKHPGAWPHERTTHRRAHQDPRTSVHRWRLLRRGRAEAHGHAHERRSRRRGRCTSAPGSATLHHGKRGERGVGRGAGPHAPGPHRSRGGRHGEQGSGASRWCGDGSTGGWRAGSQPLLQELPGWKQCTSSRPGRDGRGRVSAAARGGGAPSDLEVRHRAASASVVRGGRQGGGQAHCTTRGHRYSCRADGAGSSQWRRTGTAGGHADRSEKGRFQIGSGDIAAYTMRGEGHGQL